MTRDEILKQYGGEAPASAPMTRDQILEQYGQPPPDPSTSFGMEMGDQILSLGGTVPSAAPALAGALNYVQEGGAEGSYGRGHEGNIARHAQSQVANPRAALLGDVASALIPVPGVAAAAAPRLAARAVEGALRWGGRAGQGLSAYSIYNDLQRGETPGLGDVVSFVLGRGSGKLANVMREGRLAKKATAPLQSIEFPKLSAEMRAALKRNKFRHDYSTGEWRDLLAPGE